MSSSMMESSVVGGELGDVVQAGDLVEAQDQVKNKSDQCQCQKNTVKGSPSIVSSLYLFRL